MLLKLAMIAAFTAATAAAVPAQALPPGCDPETGVVAAGIALGSRFVAAAPAESSGLVRQAGHGVFVRTSPDTVVSIGLGAP